MFVKEIRPFGRFLYFSRFFSLFIFFRMKKCNFAAKCVFFWTTDHCSMIIVLRICAVDVTAGEERSKMQFLPI